MPQQAKPSIPPPTLAVEPDDWRSERRVQALTIYSVGMDDYRLRWTLIKDRQWITGQVEVWLRTNLSWAEVWTIPSGEISAANGMNSAVAAALRELADKATQVLL